MRSSARYTVLIVSDGSCTAGVEAAFLRQGNLQLVRHTEIESAAEAIRVHRPDLIIQELDEALDRLLASELGGSACSAIPSIRFFPTGIQSVQRPGAVLPLPIDQREYFETVRKFIPLPKRRALRHEVNLRVVYEDDAGKHHAFSRDLSLYGAFVKTDRMIPSGTRLQLTFRLPGSGPEIRCAALVRQAAPVQSDVHATQGFGVEFEGLADDDLARLQKFIERSTPRKVFSLSSLG